jgi:hypothetical protein
MTLRERKENHVLDWDSKLKYYSYLEVINFTGARTAQSV